MRPPKPAPFAARSNASVMTTAAVLCCPLAYAQDLFPSVEEIEAGTNSPRMACSIDLDGDGLRDIAAVSWGSTNLRLFPNEGALEFGPTTVIPLPMSTDDRVEVLRACDLDGDSLEDLALIISRGSAPSSTLLWLQNLGEGQFSVRTILEGSSLYPSLALGDAEGDGDVDLVIYEYTIGPRIVTFDNGGYTVGPVFGPDGAFDVTFVDVNADGLDDLFMSALNPDRWLLATALGGGSFSVPRTFMPSATEGAYWVQWEDLDADGDPEMLVHLLSSQQEIRLYENLGGGVLSPAPTIHSSTEMSSYREPFADVDGDGLVDVIHRARISSQSSALRTYVRLNLGGLQFDAPRWIGEISTLAGDLDQDGLEDALHWGSGRFYHLTHSGPPTDPWFDSQATVGDVYQLKTGLETVFDVEHDGVPDIVVNGFDLDTESFVQLGRRGRGALHFDRFEDLDALDLDAGRTLATGDLNGDGLEDRIVLEIDISAARPTIATRLQRPDGTFTPLQRVSGGLTSGWSMAADMDGDGDLDLIEEDNYPSIVSVWVGLNDGTGLTFQRQHWLHANQSVRDAVPHDFNGDGLLDLATLESSGALAVRLNTGVGFGAPIVIEAATPFQTIQWTRDLDGDGHLDLAGTRNFLNEGQILRGPLSTAPASSQPLNLDVTSAAPVVADLDRDGIQDVFYTTPPAYALGLPGGGFGARIEPWTQGAFGQIADLDADGDLDAVLLQFGSIFISKNQAVPSAGEVPTICDEVPPNSTGAPGALHAYGVPSAAGPPMGLQATGLPTNVLGIFIGSTTIGAPTPVVGSSGQLCLTGSIGRYDAPHQVASSGPAGIFTLDLNPSALETAAGPTMALAGETWFFQAWHRDTDNGQATSALTSALSLTFTP